jgi:hypothetical protein
MRSNFVLITVLLIGLLSSCRPSGPDLSDIEPGFDWVLFDSIMMKSNPADIVQHVGEWRKAYPFLLENGMPDSVLAGTLSSFLLNPMVSEVFKQVSARFGPDGALKPDLELALKHVVHYFPAFNVPRIYTYVSGLDYAYPVKYSDSAMALALDMYLGADFLPYRSLGLPRYKQLWFTSECLVRDCMEEIYLARHSRIEGAGTMLDYMMDTGKKYAFISSMIPELEDSILLRYSSRQLEWCDDNEANIWAFILEQELLFSGDREKIGRYVQDGPFTPGFADDSPGRLADYLGWKIIESYLRKNPETSLASLMEMRNARAILDASGYKP